jgi:hypothetical protein
MNAHDCECGYQASSPEDLNDHLHELLAPDDDTGLDGQAHAEAARDKESASSVLGCLCGFTGTAADLDGHLLRLLAPTDGTGRDGRNHRARQPASRAGGEAEQAPASTATR